MALKGTNQELGRPYNRRIVLEAIRLHGPVSRAAIAARIGLSGQTIANIIRDLEDENLLAIERETPTRRGQPAFRYAIAPDGAFAIGLQLSPEAIGGVLVDLAGTVRLTRRLPIRSTAPDEAFPRLAAMVAELRAAQPSRRHLGVGLVIPGPFDVEGMSFTGPTTLDGWSGIPIAERLSALTGLPTFLGIDASAAAQGELYYGAGRTLGTFFHVYFGYGLGGGTILGRDPWRGRWGNAGELGHFPIVPGGDPCPCGNRGCLERYVSWHALRRRLVQAGIDPDRADLLALTAADHPAIRDWLEEAAPLLQRAIVAVENLLDPEAVIVGGILPDLLLDRLVAAMAPMPGSISRRIGRTAPRILRSSIGPDGALLGAAVLAMTGMLSPRFGLLFGGADEAAEARPLARAVGY